MQERACVHGREEENAGQESSWGYTEEERATQEEVRLRVAMERHTTDRLTG
jgi:hypothetical protein